MSAVMLGKCVISGCDTTAYPLDKRKFRALKPLSARDYPGLVYVLHETVITNAEMLEVAKPFFIYLYDKKQ